MPSGEKLPADALTLHRQAADHLDDMRRQTGPLVGETFSDAARPVCLVVELDNAAAWNLAQFLKRVGFTEFRNNAQDDDEAYGMRDAADKVRQALTDAGIAPR